MARQFGGRGVGRSSWCWLFVHSFSGAQVPSLVARRPDSTRAATHAHPGARTPLALSAKAILTRHHQTPLEMRKRVVVFILITVAVGTATIAWLVPHPATTGFLTVSFTGREPGLPYRAAGFYVTNCGPQAFSMYQVKIQSAGDGSWKTLSEKAPEISPVLEPGTPRITNAGRVTNRVNYSPHLEAGEHRKIVVEWPEDQPWRVCILYAPEKGGLDALLAKTRIAWRTRSMPRWDSRVFGGSGEIRQVISEEVTR